MPTDGESEGVSVSIGWHQTQGSKGFAQSSATRIRKPPASGPTAGGSRG